VGPVAQPFPQLRRRPPFGFGEGGGGDGAGGVVVEQGQALAEGQGAGVVDPTGQQGLVDHGEPVDQVFTQAEDLVGVPAGHGEGEGDLVGGEVVGLFVGDRTHAVPGDVGQLDRVGQHPGLFVGDLAVLGAEHDGQLRPGQRLAVDGGQQRRQCRSRWHVGQPVRQYCSPRVHASMLDACSDTWLADAVVYRIVAESIVDTVAARAQQGPFYIRKR
jgi:hypothetical protein